MPSRTDLLAEDYLRREGHDPKKFRYFYPDGRPYRDKAGIARIASLAVPPAYEDVYVAPDADAEVQAFGRDAAGRLQYRYHPDFVQAGALKKWQRLSRFAGALPTLKAVTGSDLRAGGLPPRKVLALMTRLLHVARFRVGSDTYARQHQTYGLSTLRQRHVKVEGNTVVFDFKGKHGVSQHKAATDRTLSGNIARLLDLPGPWLFQTVDAEGERRRIHAPELNAYLREVIGPFTAKDFRTWGGTLLAAEYLAEAGVQETERAARKVLVECVKVVAADLGNTPAVTRGSYVCPVIFDRYLEGKVLDDYEPRTARQEAELEGLTRSEAALSRLLASEKTLRGRSRERRATGA
ncbi:DNA topoisomerase IB [Deinococcus gobiensis]|uniref:DNA topoisomerase n=1 Tax=Deinococcus gobiensis (strain DSM 21396 / JCM 16679 / CGMCC 1.7299 / I-0) TaxID=745776 RepID=H8GVF0_DEIGI|nr:DNA topoisomerase IB [Deinococcus gobiensis]AFD24327.1 Type I topoisomerase, putative [Deinococcus gobiensis I-0]